MQLIQFNGSNKYFQVVRRVRTKRHLKMKMQEHNDEEHRIDTVLHPHVFCISPGILFIVFTVHVERAAWLHWAIVRLCGTILRINCMEKKCISLLPPRLRLLLQPSPSALLLLLFITSQLLIHDTVV